MRLLTAALLSPRPHVRQLRALIRHHNHEVERQGPINRLGFTKFAMPERDDKHGKHALAVPTAEAQAQAPASAPDSNIQR